MTDAVLHILKLRLILAQLLRFPFREKVCYLLIKNDKKSQIHNSNTQCHIPKYLLNNGKVNIPLLQKSGGSLGQFELEKDRAVNSGNGTHGGSYWKLKQKGKKGYWTLGKDGTVLRRKK
ncbi:hypothetical protein JJB07_11495 [Tumebacillus sp. ITR2]|uniref:Novel toxin 21 domain-containing protein n=1 Tax=Tumebacillus amylolyticus TaxID=2801339 RepID=A0ABS1JAS1_9BACL|nr:hypothetical protein [Tumebacillus amylolyticus]MBL0387275.1 hypothetical protein [Tumebacillus amylolyticus]